MSSSRPSSGVALRSWEKLTAKRGARVVIAGVNTGRHLAYQRMVEAGYRSGGQGVWMHRPNAEGIGEANDFVLDDLR